jgi:hypothetical protein
MCTRMRANFTMDSYGWLRRIAPLHNAPAPVSAQQHSLPLLPTRATLISTTTKHRFCLAHQLWAEPPHLRAIPKALTIDLRKFQPSCTLLSSWLVRIAITADRSSEGRYPLNLVAFTAKTQMTCRT